MGRVGSDWSLGFYSGSIIPPRPGLFDTKQLPVIFSSILLLLVAVTTTITIDDDDDASVQAASILDR